MRKGISSGPEKGKRRLELDDTAKRRETRRSKRRNSKAENDAAALPRPARRCRDMSLGYMTMKFFELVDRSTDGVVDLNQAAQALMVRKRRVYDITNVLEGIHLMKKPLKNKVQWLGCLPIGVGSLALKRQLAQLAKQEQELDRLIQSTTRTIRRMTKNTELQKFAYVTFQDIRMIGSLRDQTVIVVKAPYETKLELPNAQESFQIHLTSTKGPIDVFLCLDEITPSSLSKSGVHVTGGIIQALEGEQYLPAPEDDEGINDLFNFERDPPDVLPLTMRISGQEIDWCYRGWRFNCRV